MPVGGSIGPQCPESALQRALSQILTPMGHSCGQKSDFEAEDSDQDTQSTSGLSIVIGGGNRPLQGSAEASSGASKEETVRSR